MRFLIYFVHHIAKQICRKYVFINQCGYFGVIDLRYANELVEKILASSICSHTPCTTISIRSASDIYYYCFLKRQKIDLFCRLTSIKNRIFIVISSFQSWLFLFIVDDRTKNKNVSCSTNEKKI